MIIVILKCIYIIKRNLPCMYTGQKPLFLMYMHIDLHIYLHPLFWSRSHGILLLKTLQSRRCCQSLGIDCCTCRGHPFTLLGRKLTFIILTFCNICKTGVWCIDPAGRHIQLHGWEDGRPKCKFGKRIWGGGHH